MMNFLSDIIADERMYNTATYRWSNE